MSGKLKNPSESITWTKVGNFLNSDKVTAAQLADLVEDFSNYLSKEHARNRDATWLRNSLNLCQAAAKTDDHAGMVKLGMDVGVALAFFQREVLYRLTLSEHFKKALNTKAINLAERDLRIVNRYKKLLKNFDDLTARQKIRDELTDEYGAKKNKKGDPIPYLTLTQINNILAKAGARKKKQKT